ncbi:hypothetical protein [Fonticella tunisiensis]|uniref:Uncharacterized protein n=1 Tax=Fonticella tunisiensis TaxID=1096341 RepID=A0A4R7K3X1_9CLOT|nr:hypothetical protein [Fonticella tunisiensis]TDT45632.1 hypothetical protein EDD71_1591 [Fonticella tunisiensis]
MVDRIALCLILVVETKIKLTSSIGRTTGGTFLGLCLGISLLKSHDTERTFS